MDKTKSISIARRIWIPLLITFVAAVFLFARAMERDLNHDEHQFLAPGALLAAQGQQPYRDYPLFHLPNLVFVYAAVYRLTDHYILGAKVVSVLASVIVVGILAFRVSQRPVFGSWTWSLPSAVAIVVLFLCDPLFQWTAGKTWNHELPAALAVIAFVCHLQGLSRKSPGWLAVSGLVLSLAIGTRLTLLPIVIPFVLAVWMQPLFAPKRRVTLTVGFTLGLLVGAAPSLYYFIQHRDAFLFGNFEFPRLRLADSGDTRAAETATWWRKFRYFIKEVVMLDRRKDGTLTGSLVLILVVALLALRPAWRWFQAWFSPRAGDVASAFRRESFPVAFAVGVLPFVMLGCALPTRYQYQHWFVVVPFLALAASEACRLPVAQPGRWQPWFLGALGVAALGLGIRAYAETIRILPTPAEWFPIRAEGYAATIRSYVSGHKVLTLAGAWPIEARLPIYPSFATGPFAWRLAHLLPIEKRRRFKVVAPADLAETLKSDPPAAILTGVNDADLEAPLIAYAERNGFERVRLAKRRELWIPPPRQRVGNSP